MSSNIASVCGCVMGCGPVVCGSGSVGVEVCWGLPLSVNSCSTIPSTLSNDPSDESVNRRGGNSPDSRGNCSLGDEVSSLGLVTSSSTVDDFN